MNDTITKIICLSVDLNAIESLISETPNCRILNRYILKVNRRENKFSP